MKKTFLPGVLTLVGAIASPIQAAPYYLQANIPSGSTWNTLSVWYDQPTDGGNNPLSMGGNDFYTNGFIVRVNTNNFFGASLTNNVANGYMLIQSAGRTLNTLNVMEQMSMAYNDADATYTVPITNLNLASTLNLRAPGGTGRFRLNAGTIQGAGTLMIGGGSNRGGSSPTAGSLVELNVTDGSDFVGTLGISIGTLRFMNSIDFSLATLALDGSQTFSIDLGATSLTLGQVTGVNFSSGFTSLSAGEYSASDLNTAIGNTIFSGSGFLTVVPEPTTLSFLLICGGAGILLRRRAARSTRG